MVTAERQIQGRKAPAVLHEEAMRVLASQRSLTYEAHEFLVPTPTDPPESINTLINHATDCSCGRASGFLGVINRAQRVSVRNRGENAVVVAYNAVTADPITVEDGESHDWDFTEVEDVLLGNTGGAAVLVRVLAA